MSIGNLKDSGNQGNNFPWQLKMLQGLQALVDANCCDDIAGYLDQILEKLQSAERTPGILSTTSAGITPIGAYSLSIANIGSADGVINGQTIPAGVTINFDGGPLNNTVGPLVYNPNGSIFLITWLE